MTPFSKNDDYDEQLLFISMLFIDPLREPLFCLVLFPVKN